MSDEAALRVELSRIDQELIEIDLQLIELEGREVTLRRRRLQIMAALVAPAMAAFAADRDGDERVAEGSAERADTPGGVG